jgi:hypothetical protein
MANNATTGNPNFSIRFNQSVLNTYLPLRIIDLIFFNLSLLRVTVLETAALELKALHSLQSAFAANAKTPANKSSMNHQPFLNKPIQFLNWKPCKV